MVPAVIEIHTLTVITFSAARDARCPALAASAEVVPRRMDDGATHQLRPSARSWSWQVSSELKLGECESWLNLKGKYRFVQHISELQDLLRPGTFLRLQGRTEACNVPEQ